MSLLQDLRTQWSEKSSAWLIRRNTMLGPHASRTSRVWPADRRRADSRGRGGMRRVPRRKRGDPCAEGDALAAGAHRVALRCLSGHASRDGQRWTGAGSWVGNLRSSRGAWNGCCGGLGEHVSRAHRSGAVPGNVRATHIAQIALLNIDADWYESVKLCLETFYDACAGGIVS